MPVLTPLDQLRFMVDADHEPTLSTEELHTLLQLHQYETTLPSWEPSTAYSVGNQVVPSPRNGLVYEVSVAGTSGTVQPPFGDISLVDNSSVTWIVASSDDAYNLNRAAAEGWRIKAGRVSNRYDIKDDVSGTSRSQQFKHCMEMYKSYRRGGYGSIPVTSESVRFG